jgi:hypothetical protein
MQPRKWKMKTFNSKTEAFLRIPTIVLWKTTIFRWKYHILFFHKHLFKVHNYVADNFTQLEFIFKIGTLMTSLSKS